MRSLNPFIGTWRLISADRVSQTGARTCLGGPHPLGTLHYDADRHMAVQMMSQKRPSAPPLLPADIRDAFQAFGYLAYFGTYEIDPHEPLITHHLEGSLYGGDVGSVQIRRYEFKGDHLTLQAGDVQLLWERVS
jgi:hypothetical protein